MGMRTATTDIPPARSTPIAITFKQETVYRHIQTMSATHTAAHHARFPGGNRFPPRVNNILDSTSVRQWPSPRTTSSTSSVTTYESENQLERTNTSDIQDLRGMVSMFTQRIGNLEMDSASTNLKLHELQKTSQTQDRNIHEIRGIIETNKSDNAVMMERLNMICTAMNLIAAPAGTNPPGPK